MYRVIQKTSFQSLESKFQTLKPTFQALESRFQSLKLSFEMRETKFSVKLNEFYRYMYQVFEILDIVVSHIF